MKPYVPTLTCSICGAQWQDTHHCRVNGLDYTYKVTSTSKPAIPASLTDLEKCKALFDELGIFTRDNEQDYTGEGRCLVIPDHGGPKNDGYYRFIARFEFDADGAFTKVGIWE